MEIVLENNRAASTVFILLTFVCLHLPSSRSRSFPLCLFGYLSQTMKSYFPVFWRGQKCLCDNPNLKLSNNQVCPRFLSLSLASSNSALQSVFHFFLRRLNERVKLYEASCGSSGSSSSDLLYAFSHFFRLLFGYQKVFNLH